jgi:hypothetical protein
MYKQQPLGHAAQPAAVSEAARRISQDSTHSDALRVLCLVEGLATAEVGRTCVLLWRGVVTDSRFQIQREALEHVVHRYPGEASVLCIIEPTSEPPPQELREAASALLNSLAPKLRCVAYVIEGTGFRAAMIRGVLSGIELVRRKAYPARYFATVGQAAAWIGVETGRKSLELSESCHQLRSRMDALDEQRGARHSALNRSWGP